MNDFEGLLKSDYGFKPQGKSAPMAGRSSSVKTTSSGYGNFIDKDDPIFNSSRGGKSRDLGSVDGFDDVFGGPLNYSSTPDNRRKGNEFDFDSMFGGGGMAADVKMSAPPVFDKPVYDDEEENVFAGDRKGSDANDFENVFASVGAASQFDDFLGGGSNSLKKDDGVNVKKDVGDFDELIPGFGGSSPETARDKASSAGKIYSHVEEDPFSGINSSLTPEGLDPRIFTEPMEKIGKVENGHTIVDESPNGIYDGTHPFERHVSERPSRTGPSTSGRHTFRSEQSPEEFATDSPGSSRKKVAKNNTSESYQSVFGKPSNANNSHIFGSRSGSPPPYEESIASDLNSPSPATLHDTEALADIWLTVSEIPLFTQPTSAPPPSRPPPPRPTRIRKTEARAPSPRNNVNGYPSAYKSTQNSQSFKSGYANARSSIDELEDFSKGKAYARGRADNDVYDDNSQAQSDSAASAAVMKEVMNRAEAKFRLAKELKERENAKASRNRENTTPKDDFEILDEFKRKEEEFEKQRFEQERMKAREREREEQDREQKRLERERAREEREKTRQAVERATREARERAAADARLRAEKAAAEKANSEARQRSERLAVQRAQAEARERAAAEAKERAAKAAAEARARSNAERAAAERADNEARMKADNEARMKAERAAVERAAKEARERAAIQARERAAAQARERASSTRASQQKPEDDLESFFSTGSRPSSAPRASANNSDSFFNSSSQTKQGTEDARKNSSSSSNNRKTSSASNFVDDLSSIFGGPQQSGSFQEMEGETEERRRARLERDQRTNERAAKALAEKNERDLQAQREQAERQRFAETLDAEIKRWAAGKEGNIRALLSTMQYILWPECGWQPVSLTDLITGASVKKAYRKATLCIHPDKVQQKGANLQQKYIAEKVFDLLKEAWNKFNSEELF